jgi:hypothetical protein
MPTFQKCAKAVSDLANSILCEFESHQPVLDAHVRIDFVFAYGDVDDNGNRTSDALTKNGVKCLGICRKMPLKDRAMGRGDAEISLDGDWWNEASEDERKALLDHELHHVAVKVTKSGAPILDDLNRPKLWMRPHDVDFGWFKIVAERHGDSSTERIQAKLLFDNYGQSFWPFIKAD